MINYRTITVDVPMQSTSSFSSKRYTPDLHELRIQIQSRLEEMDELGYELISMNPVPAAVMGTNFIIAYILVFKLVEST